MTKHTSEPWGEPQHKNEAGMGDCFVVRKQNKELVFIANEQDARRIVACVNACVGIPDEGLNVNLKELIEKTLETLADSASLKDTRIAELEAKVAELTEECGYDQRNAAMSQEEAWNAYERIDVLHTELFLEREKVERLELEVRILRQYGNNDCTTMADEALAATEPKK